MNYHQRRGPQRFTASSGFVWNRAENDADYEIISLNIHADCQLTEDVQKQLSWL